jgi:hypothetical protein
MSRWPPRSETINFGALSVASAVLLILESSEQYAGFMRVSDTAIQPTFLLVSR